MYCDTICPSCCGVTVLLCPTETPTRKGFLTPKPPSVPTQEGLPSEFSDSQSPPVIGPTPTDKSLPSPRSPSSEAFLESPQYHPCSSVIE